MSRADRITTFLAHTDWAGAVPLPLAGDASARRYLRLQSDTGGKAVLMDAPPQTAGPQDAFAAIGARLTGWGYSVPQIHAADLGSGLILMEDLGDARFADWLVPRPQDEAMLYGHAVDLLADLQRRPGGPKDLPPYDAATYRREVLLAVEWYLPLVSDAAPDPHRAEELARLMADALAALPARPPVCILRDYHAENLLWLPQRQGLAKVGLLDFQDALAGHPVYDLVSLLEDARRDVAAGTRAQMLTRFAKASDMPEPEVREAFAVLGAQRNLKILGIFARLHLRDGKRRYLKLLPRVWAHVARDLAHPALADLRAWVAEHLPAPSERVGG
jgi:N-acetylmuramate 1-kinase